MPSDEKPKKQKNYGERKQDEIRRDLYALFELDRIAGEAEEAVDSLKAFLKYSWPTVNPGVNFVENWHLDCLCEHLEALYARQFRRLIINIMPRSYKSGLVSIHFPAWVWLKAAHEKFLCASFGRNLSRRHSRQCRDLIKSKWYQDRWGSRFVISRDQDEKSEFANDKGGYRIAGSVEAGILGSGGNFRIFDDPNDLDRMMKEPDSYPQTVREWYSGTASSRHIDPISDCQLCIQQRSSYGDDLTEYLMELGGWEQVIIPNEYDGRKFLGPLAYPDPRSHFGELMFPARFGPEETDLEKRQKRQHYEGQFNQNPTVAGKTGLKREWFNFYVPAGTDAKPVRIALSDGSHVEKTPIALPAAFEQLVHSLDCAFKGNEDNDYVADHVWSRLGANVFLLHREHGHWNFPETLAVVRKLSAMFPCPEKLIEDKANGPAVIQTLRNEIPGLIAVNPEGGKWSRVAAVSGYVESGNVYLPHPDLYPWVWELLAEFAAGQSARHDDDTDAMTQALKRLFDAQAQSGLPEFRVSPLAGEPSTACHVTDPAPVFFGPANARLYIALVPGRAALWFAEFPSGAMRVYRELSLDKIDALQAGQKIAALTLPDLNPALPIDKKQPINAAFDILMPKPAFAHIESVGSWAELMEAALLAWEKPEGDWEERKHAKAIIAAARFRSELIEEEVTTSLDRLRSLLAFTPPEWTTRRYDRKLALTLAEKDLGEYHDYMAQVEGRVRGEWPKLKMSANCPQTIAQMGTVRRDKLDALPPFIEALLIGVSAPARLQQRPVSTTPYIVSGGSQMRNQKLLSRKFSMR